MLTIEFDETLESDLPEDELWSVVVEAFEAPERSPLWPSDLEATDLDELVEGATLTGEYRLGPFELQAPYRIAEVGERSFRYETRAGHPLEGGATVAVEAGPGGRSAIRWSGSYRPRSLVTGLGAVVFVRGYFLRAFFGRLRENLRAIDARRTGGDEMAAVARREAVDELRG